MEKLDDFEIWRQIPPEEKLQLMSRAQAKGVSTSSIAILIACTLAVGFKTPPLIWCSFIIAPLLFQFAAGKAWRDLRPRVMLEYLAARSAARRYAYTANSQDLGISLMFKGNMEEVFDAEHAQEAIESAISKNNESAVWIALFNDSLVLMSERVGGAHCEMATLLNDKVTVRSRSLDDGGDYSSNKEIYIDLAPDRGRGQKRYKVTSPYPAALVVFEKKLQQTIDRSIAAKEAENPDLLDAEY